MRDAEDAEDAGALAHSEARQSNAQKRRRRGRSRHAGRGARNGRATKVPPSFGGRREGVAARRVSEMREGEICHDQDRRAIDRGVAAAGFAVGADADDEVGRAGAPGVHWGAVLRLKAPKMRERGDPSRR